MDIRAYIESGILESYVMGLATDAEKREVEKYAAEFPEIKRELLAIEMAMNEYAKLHQKTPPPSVKEKVMAEIYAGDTRSAKIIDIHTAKPSEKNVSGNTNTFWVAASVTLLMLSALGNYFLYNKWKNAEQQLVALNNEKVMLADQLQVQKTSYDQMNHDMDVLKQPFNKVVMMKGIPTMSPASLATIYWNQNTKEVFINVNSLPAPPPDKQYQLWALADGKPIDAGVFDVGDTSGLQKMKTIEAAQAFAVTLEQKGGSPAPTLTAMYVMGTI